MMGNIIVEVIALRQEQQQMNKLPEVNSIYISVFGLQNAAIVFS